MIFFVATLAKGKSADVCVMWILVDGFRELKLGHRVFSSHVCLLEGYLK